MLFVHPVAVVVAALPVVVYQCFLCGFWVQQALSWEAVAGEFPCD